MSKSFQSWSRTGSRCPKEAEVRNEGLRQRSQDSPPAEKRASAIFKTKHLIGHRDRKDTQEDCQLQPSSPQRYAWLKCKYIMYFVPVVFMNSAVSPTWQPLLDRLSVMVEDCLNSYGLLQNKPAFSTHVWCMDHWKAPFRVLVCFFVVVTFVITVVSFLNHKMIVL